ncbi:hypothetical protein GCM10022415_20190 [Knoellia locipacati]|uniref:Uncharacterized protein n=1 Tax=Knoellia locipacati TaxID=882824 RepID=A0A512T189_9MICO|nr:hypothetical protein [Knoellia locipacati]GEQ13967.1 hypothetical protein KLO01_20140 [Knoellia locipacati]
MWQLIVGFVVVIAVLVFVLNRRGSGGLSSSTRDTVEGALAESRWEGRGGGYGGGTGGI